MSSIAIIPARGGSKRIPRKNIRNFCGRPMAGHVIEVALESNCFDDVMVSTDDEEVAEVSKKFGAQVPFYRSEANSSDTATLSEVVLEVLSQFRERGRFFDRVCCILPTAALLGGQTLQHGAQTLAAKDACDAVVTVCKFSTPILRSLMLAGEFLRMNWPENLMVRSQDLPDAYFDAGMLYWLKVDRFMAQRTLFPKNTVPLVLKPWEVQDIDDEDDWRLAEMKYEFLRTSQTT